MKKCVLILGLILSVCLINESRAISCTSSGIDENGQECQSCGENCSWSFNDGVLKVSGDIQFYEDGDNTPWRQAGLTENIVTIDASDVTSFNNSSFENLLKAKTVIMPQGITTLSAELFRRCVSLETLEIPDSVTSIRKKALSVMPALKNLIISDSVTYIDPTAFEDSPNLNVIYCKGDVSVCQSNLSSTGLESFVKAAPKSRCESSKYYYSGAACLTRPNNGILSCANGYMQNGNICQRKIYTIDEANQAAGKTNTFTIRYR